MNNQETMTVKSVENGVSETATQESTEPKTAQIIHADALRTATEAEATANAETDETFGTTPRAASAEVDADVKDVTYQRLKNPKKTFSAAGVAEGVYDLATGQITCVFCDVPAEKSAGGVSVSHVFCGNTDSTRFGNGFCLNLDETLLPSEENSDYTEYLYRDALGGEHPMREYYYYLNSAGEKVYVTDKDKMQYNEHGELIWDEAEILTIETRSDTGLQLNHPPKGITFSAFLESRTEELAQAEEQKRVYENTLLGFRGVKKTNGETAERLTALTMTEIERFSDEVAENNTLLLLSEGEQSQYMSLLTQNPTLSVELYNNEDKKNSAIETLQTLSRSYFSVLANLEAITRSTPVCYLSDGNEVRGYNKEGNLVAVVDKYGNYAIPEYERYLVNGNEGHRIARLYDNQNRAVIFAYDSTGRLARISDAVGGYVTYEYNSDNQLTAIAYSDGRRAEIVYNGDDICEIINVNEKRYVQLVRVTSNAVYIINNSFVDNIPAGADNATAVPMSSMQILRAEYPSYQEVEVTFIYSPSNAKELYCLRDENVLFSYTKEEGGVVVAAERYSHTPYWEETHRTNAGKYIVRHARKSNLYISSLENFTYVDGETETTIFNQWELPEKKIVSFCPVVITEDGTLYQETVTLYDYDEQQRLIAEHATTTYFYPETETPTASVTLPEDEIRHTLYAYHASGNLARTEHYTEGAEESHGRNIEEYSYDEQGNCVCRVVYNSLDSTSKMYTEREYDSTGKPVCDKDETGVHCTRYRYDGVTGAGVATTLPNGSVRALGYDAEGRVTSVCASIANGEENNIVSQYTCGLLTKTESAGTKVEYEYDGCRRISRVKINDKERFTYTYGENVTYQGETVDKITVKMAPAEGSIPQEGYATYTDKHGRVVAAAYLPTGSGEETMLEYTYDNSGCLTRIDDGVAEEHENYIYDELNYLTRFESSQVEESFVYDQYGNLRNRNIGRYGNYWYRYDKTTGRLKKTLMGDNEISEVKADALGRNIGRSLLVGDVVVAEEDISYRKVGDHATLMPASFTRTYQTANGGCIDKESITYDACGNITCVRENGIIRVRYTYDALSRLVREDNRKLDKTTLFVYDKNGNILYENETDFTLARNLYNTTFTTHRYLYEGDRLVSRDGIPCTYDANGKPTSYLGRNMSWMLGKYLSGVDYDVIEHDGRGRVTRRYVYPEGLSSPEEYIYDSQEHLIACGDRTFFYDHTGVAGMKTGSQTYFFSKNVLGDVVAVTNAAGIVLAKYIYDAWGNHIVYDADGSVVDENEDPDHIGHRNPFRYRGYFYDAKLGFYYLRSRYYDPVAKRFLSPDDIAYLAPNTINGLNLYAYCGGNPVNKIDPSGHIAITTTIIISVIVGAAALGVSSAITQYRSHGWDVSNWD